MRALISVVVLAVVIALSYHEVKSQGATSFSGFDLVDKTGNIRKPDGYRDHYQMLGTFAVFNAIPMSSGSPREKSADIHYTYASPGTAEYYRKNGKFPDGAVLVKEVFGTDHGKLTTGDAHWASGTKQWFVMIKDAKGRYPGNPLWGDGWGWALFKSDAPDKQVATNYKKDCLNCHIPAQATDWIYVQGYPVLAKK
jgi:Cytochrome P460